MDSQTQRGLIAGGDEESASRMTMEEPPAESGVWKLDHVDIRKATNSGFIVSCSKTKMGKGGSEKGPSIGLGQSYQNNDYAFSSLDEVVGFLQKEFGGTAAPADTSDVGEEYEEA